MKAKDTDILILPGLGGGQPDTWYHRWLPKLSTARRVEQPDFWKPDCDVWVANVVAAVGAAKRPVVLIGHSTGVVTAMHATPVLPEGKVRGAFLVAPPDLEACRDEIPASSALLPVPEAKLPYPALVVASRSDPYCDFAVAKRFAESWGARLIDAGDAGHLNQESGHGPWPEGSLTFARFVAGLKSPE